MRAKGKEAGGFPSCFHRHSQALLAPGSIPSLRIALLEVVLVLAVPLAPAPLAPTPLPWPTLASRDSSRA